jgi:hypothetical protein
MGVFFSNIIFNRGDGKEKFFQLLSWGLFALVMYNFNVDPFIFGKSLIYIYIAPPPPPPPPKKEKKKKKRTGLVNFRPFCRENVMQESLCPIGLLSFYMTIGFVICVGSVFKI